MRRLFWEKTKRNNLGMVNFRFLMADCILYANALTTMDTKVTKDLRHLVDAGGRLLRFRGENGAGKSPPRLGLQVYYSTYVLFGKGVF